MNILYQNTNVFIKTKKTTEHEHVPIPKHSDLRL